MTATACMVVEDDGVDMEDEIRRMLEYRHAMHIGELCMSLGQDEERVRTELDRMIERGDVQRLRPVGHALDDQDYFRVADGRSGVEVSVRSTNVWIRPVYGKNGCD